MAMARRVITKMKKLSYIVVVDGGSDFFQNLDIALKLIHTQSKSTLHFVCRRPVWP